MAAREPHHGSVRTRFDADRTSLRDEEQPVAFLKPLDRVRAAEEEVAALLVEVDQLSEQVERLRARASTSEREAVLLGEHLSTKSSLAGELHTEVVLLRRQLEEARGERAQLVGQLHAARTRAEGRSAELDAARRELETLRAERETSRRELESERDSLREERQARQRAETEIEASSAHLEALRAGTRALRDELEAMSVVAAAERERAEASAGELSGMRARLEMAELEASLLRDRVGEAEEGLAVLTAELSGGLAGLNESREEVSELLSVTEQVRDAYARHLKATASTTLGRLAYRWVAYGERYPRIARLLRAPLSASWALVTLRRPGWLRQHPLFDRAWYVETNRDVRTSRLRPWWHYVRHGVPEGRMPNRYFDREWYLNTYPDVRLGRMDPLEHYFRRGCWEGRDPSPRFATDWYLAQHPDVAAAGINPLLHFLRVGVHQGFDPAPPRLAGRAVRGPGTPTRAGASRERRAPSASPSLVEPVARVSPVRPDVRSIRRLVARGLPAGARLGVVSDGDDELLRLPGVTVTPVPRGPEGERAGDVPRNDLSAIAHVEWLRVDHVDYLLAADPSLWLTAVPGLVEHLDRRYERLGEPGDRAMLWDLRAPAPSALAAGAGPLEDAIARLRVRLGRDPSVLDWDSGLGLARVLSGATVFSPLDGSRLPQPYADDSVDVVVLPPGDDGRWNEARRVARSLLAGAPAGERPPVLEWLDGEDPRVAASVSVVVPTYNDVTMLAGCLRTLDETLPVDLDVEVIVADDGSEERYLDELHALVKAHPRARLVRNAANEGYIAAVMTGVAAARNDVLVFLNNDTVLLPGWLEPLLETFRRRPDVGVVGGMLLYPDGRLQEAGCAIFDDGSATKLGYGDSDPTLPYYAHPRRVDYVSGALLATPRALFEELGGLDPAFGFGYYEDGDYCFRVRRSGRDVVYEPRSRVVHVEGGTAGLDLTRGAKQFQARNQALFVERWQEVLRHQPSRPRPLDLYASRDLILAGGGGASGTQADGPESHDPEAPAP